MSIMYVRLAMDLRRQSVGTDLMRSHGLDELLYPRARTSTTTRAASSGGDGATMATGAGAAGAGACVVIL